MKSPSLLWIHPCRQVATLIAACCLGSGAFAQQYFNDRTYPATVNDKALFVCRGQGLYAYNLQTNTWSSKFVGGSTARVSNFPVFLSGQPYLIGSSVYSVDFNGSQLQLTAIPNSTITQEDGTGIHYPTAGYVDGRNQAWIAHDDYAPSSYFNADTKQFLPHGASQSSPTSLRKVLHGLPDGKWLASSGEWTASDGSSGYLHGLNANLLNLAHSTPQIWGDAQSYRALVGGALIEGPEIKLIGSIPSRGPSFFQAVGKIDGGYAWARIEDGKLIVTRYDEDLSYLGKVTVPVTGAPEKWPSIAPSLLAAVRPSAGGCEVLLVYDTYLAEPYVYRQYVPFQTFDAEPRWPLPPPLDPLALQVGFAKHNPTIYAVHHQEAASPNRLYCLMAADGQRYYVLEFDTTARRLLRAIPILETEPNYDSSPVLAQATMHRDGRHITFNRTGEIGVLDLETGTVKVVAAPGLYYGFNPLLNTDGTLGFTFGATLETAAYNPVDTIYAYDVAHRRWTTGTSMPSTNAGIVYGMTAGELPGIVNLWTENVFYRFQGLDRRWRLAPAGEPIGMAPDGATLLRETSASYPSRNYLNIDYPATPENARFIDIGTQSLDRIHTRGRLASSAEFAWVPYEYAVLNTFDWSSGELRRLEGPGGRTQSMHYDMAMHNAEGFWYIVRRYYGQDASEQFLRLVKEGEPIGEETLFTPWVRSQDYVWNATLGWTYTAGDWWYNQLFGWYHPANQGSSAWAFHPTLGWCYHSADPLVVYATELGEWIQLTPYTGAPLRWYYRMQSQYWTTDSKELAPFTLLNRWIRFDEGTPEQDTWELYARNPGPVGHLTVMQQGQSFSGYAWYQRTDDTTIKISGSLSVLTTKYDEIQTTVTLTFATQTSGTATGTFTYYKAGKKVSSETQTSPFVLVVKGSQ